jgi:hypothetical protein
MEMIKIEKYLPDSVRKATHKDAQSMEQMVRILAETNEGRLQSFDVPNPGTALLFVIGDLARQAILREFRRLENVVVSEVSALTVQQEKNQRAQERTNKMRAALAKRMAK